jgi:hypothetical protein
MNEISDSGESRRCPKCAGIDVYRTPRRGFFELVLLSSISVRPFRCQDCSNRFYAFRVRGRESYSRRRSLRLEPEAILSVLVYGYGMDKEPFQEEANMRLVSRYSAELTLAAKVEPGQKLILLDLTSDEEQRCRVASVTERPDGSGIVGVRFRQSIWEFWSTARFSSRE